MLVPGHVAQTVTEIVVREGANPCVAAVDAEREPSTGREEPRDLVESALSVVGVLQGAFGKDKARDAFGEQQVGEVGLHECPRQPAFVKALRGDIDRVGDVDTDEADPRKIG